MDPYIAFLRVLILCNQSKYHDAIDALTRHPNIQLVLEEVRRSLAGRTDDWLLCVCGDALRQRGDFVLAVKFLKHSARFGQQLGDECLLAESLHQLGVLYRDNFEDLERGRAYFEDSLRLWERCSDKVGKARALHELGIIAQLSDNFGEALYNYEQALESALETQEWYQFAHTLAQIARISADRGQHVEAAAKLLIVREAMKRFHSSALEFVESLLRQLKPRINANDLVTQVMPAMEEDQHLQALCQALGVAPRNIRW